MNDLLQQIAENEAFSRESRRLKFCKQCGRELSVLVKLDGNKTACIECVEVV